MKLHIGAVISYTSECSVSVKISFAKYFGWQDVMEDCSTLVLCCQRSCFAFICLLNGASVCCDE